MRIRAVLCVLGLLLASATAEAQFRPSNPSPGENFGVELGLMFWWPNPELLIQSGAPAGITNSEVDFVDAFGLESKRFTEFRAVLKAGQHHKIRFSYVPFTYTRETTLQRDINFAGQTFPVNVPVALDLEWKLWRFGYEWDFVARDRGLVGLLTDFKYNQISTEIEALGRSAAFTETEAGVPTIGVIGRAYVHPNVSITAEFSGFHLPGFVGAWFTDDDDDIEVEMSDFDFYVNGSVSRHFGVQGGYRAVTADYVVDEDEGDLKMKGWYFGAVVRF